MVKTNFDCQRGAQIKKSLLLVFMLVVFINMVSAMPPPSPDQQERADRVAKLCQDTGGVAKEEYTGGCQEYKDGKCVLDIAGSVFTRCDCGNGLVWNSSIGCIQGAAEPAQKDKRFFYVAVAFVAVLIIVFIVYLIYLFIKIHKK